MTEGSHQPAINEDALIIEQLARTEGIAGSLLVGADGLPAVSAGFRNGNLELFTEQALEILRVCHVLSVRLGAGGCLDAVIAGDRGRLMAVVVDDRILVALTGNSTAAGPATTALREAARRLRELARN